MGSMDNCFSKCHGLHDWLAVEFYVCWDRPVFAKAEKLIVCWKPYFQHGALLGIRMVPTPCTVTSLTYEGRSNKVTMGSPSTNWHMDPNRGYIYIYTILAPYWSPILCDFVYVGCRRTRPAFAKGEKLVDCWKTVSSAWGLPGVGMVPGGWANHGFICRTLACHNSDFGWSPVVARGSLCRI
jgi:hypothetical protein